MLYAIGIALVVVIVVAMILAPLGPPNWTRINQYFEKRGQQWK